MASFHTNRGGDDGGGDTPGDSPGATRSLLGGGLSYILHRL